MMNRFAGAFRRNVWLLLTGFAAFVSAALVGFLADGVVNDTAALVWAGIVWGLMLLGVVIVVVALLDVVTGSGK